MNELFRYHCYSLLYNVLYYIRSAKRSLGLILVHQSLLGHYWDISAVSMGYKWVSLEFIGVHKVNRGKMTHRTGLFILNKVSLF